MTHFALFLTLATITANPTPGDLQGKVVDSTDKPVAQATVFIYTAKPRVGAGVQCPSCYADCGKKAETDAEGRFRIEKLASDLLFRVLVVAEGYQPQFARDVDPDQGSLAVKLVSMPSDLAGRAVLRGRILDPAGVPVVWAVVYPCGGERADRRWLGQKPGVDAASVTNLRGEFLITGNSGDLGYDLAIEARGFAKRLVDRLPTNEKKVDAQDKSLPTKPGVVVDPVKGHEIRLTKGVTVCGRILKSGKPVVGIGVGLVQCDTDSGQFVGPYHIATDERGQYTMANVHPNDEYYLFTPMSDAAKFGGILPVQRVAVGADDTVTNIGDSSLAETFHAVAGRIVLTDGSAVPPNTRVMLSREELGTWNSQTATAAADGSFRFDGVPEEAVSLNVRISHYRLAANRNRFQQIQPWAVAVFVDADKSLELFFEPEKGESP